LERNYVTLLGKSMDPPTKEEYAVDKFGVPY
jgi:hypothetical protein